MDQRENAIPLCPQCHDAFDETSALGWVLVPTDLDFFLHFEREDFERRKEVFNTTGSRPGRICPSPLQYQQYQEQWLEEGACGGLYTSYVLRHNLYRLEGYPKSWHGDPMVALDKAFKALVLSSTAFPPDVKNPLRDLLELYDKNDEPPEKALSGGTASRSFNQRSNNDRPDDNGDVTKTSLSLSEMLTNPTQNRSKPSASSQPRRSGRLTEKNQNTLKRKRNSEEPAEAVLNRSLRENNHPDLEHRRKRYKPEVPWKWGPRTTSQMAMKFYDANHHIPQPKHRTRSSIKQNDKRA